MKATYTTFMGAERVSFHRNAIRRQDGSTCYVFRIAVDYDDVTIHLDEQMYNGLQGVDGLTIKREEEKNGGQDGEAVLQVSGDSGV